MTDEKNSRETTENPLAGVLDRLLDRERGLPVEQRRPAKRIDRGVTGTPESEPSVPIEKPLVHERRMLAIAGPGTGLGDAAVQSAAQWATLVGRNPAVADLGCGESRPGSPVWDPGASAGGEGVPRARVPCDLDRVRCEPAEVVLALLERLRRHEFASDLLLVRAPIRERRTLLRAAFLSGALVVPVEESEGEFREAVKLAREVVESFLEISIWPFARSPRCLERFLAAVPEEIRALAVPFDPGRLDLKTGLYGLQRPPCEGFLVGLLAPEPAVLPDGLLQIDLLRI